MTFCVHNIDIRPKVIAEFKETKVNRIMYVTYKFGGFKEIERIDNRVLLEHNLAEVSNYLQYIEVIIDE